MIDHVWEKCPNNTNAVERKNGDAKDGVTVSIRQGLVNLYKLDKSYCAKHIAAQKNAEVGAVIPEQKLLKWDVNRGVCRVKEIKMLFKDLQTNPATSKPHQKGITCIKSSYLNNWSLHRKRSAYVFEKRPKKANAPSAIMENDDFMDTITSKPR